MTFQRNSYNSNPFSSLTSLIFLVLLFVGLYFIAKSVFWLLSQIAVFLVIITLIIDYKVLVGYANWIVNLFLKKNWIMGIGVTLLTVFGFPIVAAFLFGKALLKRQLGKVVQKHEEKVKGEFVEYEEVDKDTPSSESFDLSELKKLEERYVKEKPQSKPKTKSKDYTDYEELF